MELYTSISSALEKICPTPAIDGQQTECTTKIITISKIIYITKSSTTTETILDFFKSGSPKKSRNTSPRPPSPLEKNPNVHGKISHRESGPLSMNQNHIKHTGSLEVRVEDSKYTTTKMRNALIISAATVANITSTAPSSCKTHKLTESVDLDIVVEQVLCASAEFAGVHYYDGTVGHVGDADMDVRWEFLQHKQGGQEILCDILMGVVDAVLIAVAPEFAIGDTIVGEYIYAECLKGGG